MVDKRKNTEREKQNIIRAENKYQMIYKSLQNFNCDDISKDVCEHSCPLKLFCDLVI